MRLSGIKMWALVITCVFLGSVAAGSVSISTTPSQQDDGPRPSAGSSPRTVLLELWTGTWCPPCANADPAISRIMDEYSPDQLVMVAYHVGGSDPYDDPSVTNPRRSLYIGNTLYVPTAIVDGGGPGSTSSLWYIGAGSNKGQNYVSYRNIIDPERSVTTNIQITMDGDLTASVASVTASIYASDPVTESNLYTRFVLYEDTLYYMGSNGEPYHRYVARALYETPLSIMMGQTVDVSHAFSVDPAWDMNRMGVVAFVQSDVRGGPWQYSNFDYYNAPVLQAAKFHYIKPNTLYVNDEGTAADYSDYMEKLLSFNNRPLESLNKLDTMDNAGTDIRGMPSQALMEEFGAVIWSTGTQITTLDTTNQADVSGYLDAHGNFVLAGENIAQDLGATSFFTDYLHATPATPPGGITFMLGVPGDPITGAWVSQNLAFPGTSPDGLEPGAGAFKMLQYPGGIGAGVRADHDADSRVVSIGTTYFQGTDARRNMMIDNILNWLDGVAGPHVELNEPNGGEEYSPGDTMTIRWHAVDVEVPTDAVDLFYTTTLSSPSWTPITSGEPNDGLYRWTIPMINTADCGVRIIVRDGDPTTPDTEKISAGPCTIGAPNVQISKSVSNPIPQVTETITYTVTLTNLGAASGYATVTDALPAGVTYISDDGDLTGTSNYFAGNTTVAWNVVVMGMSSVSLHIDVTVENNPPGTIVTNWAFFNSTSKSGGTPQSGGATTDFEIPSLTNWQLTLQPGKYLISIPLQLIDYRVEIVLASIAGKYDYVRSYDASDNVNPWKTFYWGRSYNSLKRIPIGTAFWINMTQTGTIFVTGARPLTTTVQLHAGWNMVGYPSLATTYTVADLKASIGLSGIAVEGYDDKSPPYLLWTLPDSYVMTEGQGYWLHVPSATNWVVTG